MHHGANKYKKSCLTNVRCGSTNFTVISVLAANILTFFEKEIGIDFFAYFYNRWVWDLVGTLKKCYNYPALVLFGPYCTVDRNAVKNNIYVYLALPPKGYLTHTKPQKGGGGKMALPEIHI